MGSYHSKPASMNLYHNTECLIFGYLRQIESEFNTDLPEDVQRSICDYAMTYSLLGIGRNEDGNGHGVLSLGEKRNLTEWTQLCEIENVISNMNNIYANRQSLIIINESHELYISGIISCIKMDDYYGLTRSVDLLTLFTLPTLNDKPILASHGSDCYHTFIYTQNGHLYANGSNYEAEFPNKSQDCYDDIEYYTLCPIPRFWRQDDGYICIVFSQILLADIFVFSTLTLCYT
eukprot:424093_1